VYRRRETNDQRAAFELVVEALRETPFWDHCFDVVDILVGVENGYAKHYGTATPTSVTA
jgi:hypothetical protein